MGYNQPMHELAVTQSILDLALQHANQAGADQVTDIYIVIGKLSSIVDDSVQFYWELIAKDTICEKARLHFERIPANLECLSCGEHYQLADELIPCPKCNSTNIKILTGNEFRLESIEITN
jgi:hydrogenase nickel incorporation protein HypA/HybF